MPPYLRYYDFLFMSFYRLYINRVERHRGFQENNKVLTDECDRKYCDPLIHIVTYDIEMKIISYVKYLCTILLGYIYLKD